MNANTQSNTLPQRVLNTQHSITYFTVKNKIHLNTCLNYVSLMSVHAFYNLHINSINDFKILTLFCFSLNTFNASRILYHERLYLQKRVPAADVENAIKTYLKMTHDDYKNRYTMYAYDLNDYNKTAYIHLLSAGCDLSGKAFRFSDASLNLHLHAWSNALLMTQKY